jgi:2-methylcitrate dehydratase PrpD
MLTLQHALGVALAHGPFPPSGGFVREGMIKEVIGWAGVVGCSAAFLAREGFSGPVGGLDRAGRYDPDQLLAGLGESYAIESTYFKPDASCRWSHPAIDGVLQLTREHALQIDEIGEIHVGGFRQVAMLDEYAPTSTVAAQYSVPFAIALALSYSGIGPGELTEGNLEDRDLLDLARRVKLSVDPELDRLFPAKTATRVTVQTARGTFSTMVEYPKGNPENPLSEAELGAKFSWLAAEILGDGRSAELKEMVDHLEELDDISRLTALLAF